MIGLDSNILIRFFTQDDPYQSPLVNELLEHHLTASQPGFVSVVVLVETLWVLRRAFKLRTAELSSVIERLLEMPSLQLQNRVEVLAALQQVQAGYGSFPDILIRELNAAAGCSATVTFDRKAARLGGFTLLDSTAGVSEIS